MKTLCLQRINKDIKEINKSPLEGIGIISLDNDPMKYVVNIKIMSGVYEGYFLQLLLTISDNYPIKPPKILIYPGQNFDNIYHHHIFRSDLKDEKNRHFNKFCFDLLDNDFMSTSSENSGWNPSYTISTLLLQVQTFLSKPDFPTGYIPPKEKIDELMNSMNNYEKTFTIKNENNEEIIKVHTWKNPYPEIYFKNDNNINEIKEDKNYNFLKEVKEDLTCFISRLNYVDDKNILLGYPIKRLGNNYLIPIPEILSYESYIQELSKDNKNNNNNLDYNFILETINVDNFVSSFINHLKSCNSNGINEQIIKEIKNSVREIIFNRYNYKYNYFFGQNYSIRDVFFKSANNEFFNSWLPIYINKEHFEKNKITILNYFSILKFGNSGLKQYDFHPQYIFEIMPTILSCMIKKMTIQKFSSAFLKCFFQNILLFKRLEKIYNTIFIKYQKFYLYKKINKLLKGETNFDIKKELLELLILFFYCDNEIKPEMKERIKDYINKLKNTLFFILFEKDIEDKYSFYNQKLLIQDLKRKKLFDKIVDIIFIDSGFLLLNNEQSILSLSEILRNKIIKKMNTNFKELYGNLSLEIKLKIRNILINEVNFSNYIDLDSINHFINNNNNIIDKPLFNYLSRSYEFISTFEFIREKVLNKDFLNDLENNFGIYLNNESFIEELNKKMKNCENIDTIISNYFGYKNLSSIKNLIQLHSLDFIMSPDYLYIKYNRKDELNYNINIVVEHIDNIKRIIISKDIYNILEKEKKIYKLKNKIIFNKKEIVKDKIIKKIKRDRINIKRSYNKTFNKSKKHYKHINIRR